MGHKIQITTRYTKMFSYYTIRLYTKIDSGGSILYFTSRYKGREVVNKATFNTYTY